ncbi:molybdenum ABC transporter ATP-binding protein [Flavobacterium sp. W21_SRS_FM6]|uniref:molybdenum ABC transporter ATP-binding protein n=1 Tax=Flavobacterium sp. W21_SRS_FM6 TaxID=3240268 RepID=UPI003F90045A
MTHAAINARFTVDFYNGNAQGFALDVDMALPGSGIIALFGHSGSGKTTLLRCIAGLEYSQQGELTVNGEVWQHADAFIATHQRQLAYVFQEASLLPHLTVQANLHYAVKRASKLATENLTAIITLMGLRPLLRQFPDQLSGGEKQRVALARSLIIQPKLILMDEPLASLDTARKQEILPYLETLKTATHVPIIYVSHDINEVARLADYVVVLEHGKVAMQGPVGQVLPHISQLQGLAEEASVVLSAEVLARDTQWHLLQVKLTNSPKSYLWLRDSGEEIGQTLRLRLLAKDLSIALDDHRDSSIANRIACNIIATQSDPDDAMILVKLQIENCSLLARITQRSFSQLKLCVGMQVWAQIKSVAIIN